MLGSPILYLKGMRILMFQLSGFYCKGLGFIGYMGPYTHVVRTAVFDSCLLFEGGDNP